jgi:hypothetical protein
MNRTMEAGVMGTVFAVALSMMLTAGGAAVAAGAPFGAAAMGGQYLAGHALLGIGLGHLTVILVKAGARRAVRKLSGRAAAGQTAVAQASEARLAPVAVLPVRPAAVAPLRGRHAA